MMLNALCKKLGLSITEENFLIRAEQMRTLASAYPSMIAANVVMAPLVAWLMWHKVEHGVLLAWLALLYSFHVLEIKHWLGYPKTITSIQECKRWQRQFLLSDALVGAAWGSAGVFMFVPNEPLFQAFLLCILMGMAAGAVAGNLVFPLSQQVYVVLVVFPIMANMLLQGSREYYLLGAMVAVFLSFVTKVGREQSKIFELSIRRGFENAQLLSELKLRNEQLALAQRESRAGVFDWDIRTGAMTWSNELFELFGLDSKSAKADFETWARLLHPDDRKAAGDKVGNSVRTGAQLFNEYRITLPDGQIKSIIAIGNVSSNERNEVARMTGLCIDVTEEVEIRRRAIKAEARYQALMENAADALFVHDYNARIVEVNRQACETLGYSREELLNLTLMDFVVGFNFARRRVTWDQLELGKPICFETVHKRKHGSQIPVEVRLCSVCIDDEMLIMALASDISERKANDEKLRESLVKLEEKELAKTRFLAAAGHDLRQPVAAANLFVDALKNTSPDHTQSRLIEKLDQSMSIFSDLLERLLNISKFDAGLIKPQITAFDIRELFQWLEQNFAATAHQKNLSFRTHLPREKSLVVRTDIALLQSVLMNLVSNAIKFTAHGGILVSARLHGNKVLVQVWDTGIGIAEENLRSIFDEFYQVGNQARNREGGLGLGLSICKRAMSLLGGEVTCRSHLDKGSVFNLRLSINGADDHLEHLPTHTAPTVAENKILVSGKKITLLEDDALVVSGVTELLLGLGAEVRHFHSAEEALRYPDIAATDFFIVDFALGGELSGLQFLLQLHEMKQAPVRAVIVTGETSSQFIDMTADALWPVLHKPINYSKLAACLGQLVR
jgi:PAS domain S-box-containing protein